MTLWRYCEGWARADFPGWHRWTYEGRGWWYRKGGGILCIADFGIDSRGRVVSTDLCERRET